MGTDRTPHIQTIVDAIGDRQLIVVSNREPYAHQTSRQDVVVERPVGGLVAALDPILQAVSGTWVAWGSGALDFTVTDDVGRVRVPPAAPRYTLKRVRLPRPEVDGYYYGYANQALWPLFHNAMDKARFRQRFWTSYQAANQRFADAVLEEVTGDAIIWMHDYHLAITPRALRRARPELFLMHFWHIPWPSWEVFRMCPQSAALLDGLLANDLIVFQHARHAQNFLQCAQEELGAQIDPEESGINYEGRFITVEAIPISVDSAALEARAWSHATERWMARFRRRFHLEGRAVVLGVDRLDYTKGIPERLQALEVFFRRFPAEQGRLVYIQKSAPTRTKIKAYRALQRQVVERIDHLNATFGTAEWRPVISLPRPLPPEGLSALYRMADVCMVSSLQDGMNLVAKEYIASQVDERGVLVLSELAGARDELHWALSINPYDPEGCAEVLARALVLPAEERRDRMTQLRTYVADHDIYRWMAQHFRVARRLLAARGVKRELTEQLAAIRETVTAGRPLALLLDFDGTLAPIADQPEQVELPERTRILLERLVAAPRTMVAVVSGRSLDDLRRRIGIDGLVYIGNHGLQIAGPTWTWSLEHAQRSRDAIASCVARLQDRLHGVPGAWVEDKGVTASVHYRQTPYPRVEEVRRAVFEEVAQMPGRTVAVHQGKKVLEIRPAVAWDKGAAARWVLTRSFGDRWRAEGTVVYIGDDRTDEDAFLDLADAAITVKVGPTLYPTAARDTVRDIEEVYAFLAALATWRSAVDLAVTARELIPAMQPSTPGGRQDPA